MKSRLKSGRNENPSLGIVDNQSVKTVNAADDRGMDGGKKIKGRKRHIVTDSQGHILNIKVHAVNHHGRTIGYKVFEETLKKYPSL
ncbi:MAG: transposase [Silvanigrellaceae bacterium]|nr:transposase [Silvanigrellaceae bacterium]